MDIGVATQWGMDMPGIVTTVDTQPGVRTLALTFDACGGPHGSGYDEALIDTLREHRVAATLFINQRWADKYPQLTKEFLADPLFSVQNHGTRHLPLSTTGAAAYGIAGTTSPADAREEVVANQKFLTERFRHTPRWFRSGTAHYDDAAVRMVQAMGIRVAGFRVNIDGGATFPAASVSEALVHAPDGAICIGHMNQPQSGTSAGVRRALQVLATAQPPIRWVTLG